MKTTISHSHTWVGRVVAVLVPVVLIGSSGGQGYEKPLQLVGLTRVALLIHVDRDLEGATTIEADLEPVAAKILATRGVTRDNSAKSLLHVVVLEHPADVGVDRVLLRIRVELSELVRLERALGPPPGARIWGVTWSSETTGVVRRDTLNAYVRRDIETRVQLFAEFVELVNRREGAQ